MAESNLNATSRKTSKAELVNDALVSSIGEGLIIVNEYGIITQVNRHALKLLGYRRSELEGEWLPRAVPSVDERGNKIPTSERPVLRALLSGRPQPKVVSYLRKDGSIITVTGTASPFMVRGRPMGAIIVFRDYTREIQIERAKDEFVSLASHQLRTPLTSIRLFAELLQQSDSGNLSVRQKEYINKVILSTTRMIDLVSDFLNISRLELGELKIQKKPIDLEKIIIEQMGELMPIAEANQIKLSFTKSSKKLKKINTDARLLSQVFHNLISNALNYTSPGEGKVNVRVNGLSSKLRVAISDNGIGIPVASRERIFERFFRADNALKAQGDGNGLGLYLAKSIIEALDGKIFYKSQENQGTTFYVELPINDQQNDKT